MPIYEYGCSVCDHQLEKLQKVNDAPLVSCPVCGQDSLVKVVSAAGFRLKGSGWYETDFKTKKPAVPSESAAQEKTSGTVDSKSKSGSDASSSTSETTTGTQSSALSEA